LMPAPSAKLPAAILARNMASLSMLLLLLLLDACSCCCSAAPAGGGGSRPPSPLDAAARCRDVLLLLLLLLLAARCGIADGAQPAAEGRELAGRALRQHCQPTCRVLRPPLGPR
jgi:hypothetical protein